MDGTDRGRRHQGSQYIHASAVSEVDVMNCTQMRRTISNPGRMRAQSVAEQGEHRRLIERGKPLHPIAEMTRYHGDVIGEPQGAVAVDPAATVVEGLRQIPVIETKPR